MNDAQIKTMTKAEAAIAYYEGWSDIAALPGFPFLPCPICRGVEGCDHTGYERANSAHPAFIKSSNQAIIYLS